MILRSMRVYAHIYIYIYIHIFMVVLYKRWGSVSELTCHLQGSTAHGIRFSHKTYRPSPTKDVT
jgi:hypothetical protein